MIVSRRIRFMLLIYLSVVLISFATRCVLLIASVHDVALSLSNLLGIFLVGLLYDLVNASYVGIPVALYLVFMPQRFYHTRWNVVVRYCFYWLILFALLFNAVSEYLFWDEFKTRYNFIAVDYLIYTTEVIGNIQQSYPITLIVVTLVFIATIVVVVTKRIVKVEAGEDIGFARRTPVFLSFLLLPTLTFFAIDSQWRQFSQDAFSNELAGNGMYELFAAYRNNSLDYHKFYPVIPDSVAFRVVKHEIAADYDTRTNDELSLYYDASTDQPERKLNVVLITVESLSAAFLNSFGGTKNITPNLDSLARQSLIFSNLYATGTRTVRGLEALSLSIPPTPGQSIVRRPDNEHLFSLASVFNAKGYACKYIYGGYGYFDNMNYFFGNNGYEVVDRNELADDEVDYENIWGVADENLFELSLRKIDESIRDGKPVFAHIMTTSNHRPFTYPDDRIDIPSHTGRDGAVKYTDYAIGKFLQEARRHPWFENTMFVITADHCASSAGRRELPVDKYKIPMLVYCPKYVSPAKHDRLMSQIDIAPTILGMLNIKYTSKFFGYDVFRLKEGHERAFISTYQSLGFIEHDTLVVLSPLRKPEVRLCREGEEDTDIVTDHPEHLNVVRDAISWYQTASYVFRHGKMKQ